MFGFAKKVGMTRIFIDGRSTPVTALQFGPQFLVQAKTKDKDGYQSIQVGAVKKKKTNKAISGHVQKHTGLNTNFRFIEEFKDASAPEDKNVFTIADFAENDLLDLTGEVIGRGFTGVVKRYGFRGQPKSHGHDHVRAPGSIGSRWPQRTLPGKKMAGHMGTNKVTLKKVKVLAVDSENNLLFVNGSVPGSNSSYLKVRKVS